MRKTLFTLLTISLLSGVASADYDRAILYKVTVTNLTKGQPLTPPVIAVHAPGVRLISLGEAASPGLAALAQDGVTQTLEAEYKVNRQVVRSVVGKGVILPGQKDEMIVEANNSKFQFTLVSMLARTNDAFAAAMNMGIHMKMGQKATYLANTYDAGVEMNTEKCAHIPAPPCNHPMQGTNGGEGFIRPHEGLLLTLASSELSGERDAFANVTAKIVIERIQ